MGDPIDSIVKRKKEVAGRDVSAVGADLWAPARELKRRRGDTAKAQTELVIPLPRRRCVAVVIVAGTRAGRREDESDPEVG